MINKNHTINATHIADGLARIRNSQPVVHSITNYVAMSFNANALLAIGASPIMAHAVEEIAAVIKLARALVINIGTLDTSWLKSMYSAMEAAKQKAIPIIIDPVGAGATPFRTQTALELCETIAPQVIRGNAAEIMALAGQSLSISKGVDSIYQSETALSAGKQLAKHYDCVIVISGKQDFIISTNSTYIVENGVALMQKVTGMGCTGTALIAAFCAVQTDYALAATSAMAVMGIAGELACPSAKGPGSLQVQFLDTLYHLQTEDIVQHLKLTRATP